MKNSPCLNKLRSPTSFGYTIHLRIFNLKSPQNDFLAMSCGDCCKLLVRQFFLKSNLILFALVLDPIFPANKQNTNT